jgi:hypothetical protein
MYGPYNIKFTVLMRNVKKLMIIDAKNVIYWVNRSNHRATAYLTAL